MIQKIVLEIYNALCYLISCNKEKIEAFSMVEEILKIEFKEINRQQTDCFHIDGLAYFLNHISCYDSKINENLTNIFIKKEPIKKMIDIKNISTVSASKSKSSGLSYESLYIFGAEQIRNKSEYKSWSFERLIEYVLKRHGNVLDLYYYTWLDKYEWSNHDASHRLGLAIYRAYENNIDYNVEASIYHIELNKEKVEVLLNTYELFIINKHTIYKITDIIGRKNYFTCELRDENKIIGFEKDRFKHDSIIRVLKKIDERYILNFNEYIRNFLDNQRKFQKKY